jgi:hypothetical protein
MAAAIKMEMCVARKRATADDGRTTDRPLLLYGLSVPHRAGTGRVRYKHVYFTRLLVITTSFYKGLNLHGLVITTSSF